MDPPARNGVWSSTRAMSFGNPGELLPNWGCYNNQPLTNLTTLIMYLTLQFIGKVNKRLTLSYSAIKIPEFPDFSLFHSFKKLLIPPPSHNYSKFKRQFTFSHHSHFRYSWCHPAFWYPVHSCRNSQRRNATEEAHTKSGKWSVYTYMYLNNKLVTMHTLYALICRLDIRIRFLSRWKFYLTLDAS